MGARLANYNNEEGIMMRELKDGQIAVIVDKRYTGTIVQRVGANCIAIGQPAGSGWTGIENAGLQVMVLKDAELIRIFDNQ